MVTTRSATRAAAAQQERSQAETKQTSYLGRGCEWLSSCCTKRVAYVAFGVSSLALVTMYLYNKYYNQDREEELDVEWRTMPDLECRREGEEIYCFHGRESVPMIDFSLFKSQIEGAITVIKNCTESKALFKEVESSGDGMLVFKSNLPYLGMETSSTGKAIYVDPTLLQDETLVNRLMVQLIRLSGGIRDELVNLSHHLCAMGKEKFLQTAQGLDQRVIDKYGEIAAQCFASGSWGPNLKVKFINPSNDLAVQMNHMSQYEARC